MKKYFVLFILLCATKIFAQTGFPDTTFNYEQREKFGDGYGFNMSYVNDLDFLNNGQLLFSGSFSDYGGWSTNGVARLNADFSIDKTFHAKLNAGSWIRKSEVAANNQIIVAGEFSSVDNQTIRGIVRLNSDGSVDNTFLIGNGINAGGIVYDFLIDANGKLVIVGDFNSVNGYACNNIARLNANGTVDVGFNTSVGANSKIYAIRQFNDGKYAIGGDFTTYQGYSRNKLAVVNTNGTADLSFNILGGFSGTIYGIDIQQDQKILTVGSIYSFNGNVTLQNIARVNIDGSLDASFSNNNLVQTAKWVEERADGTIIVSGQMQYYDANGLMAQNLMVINNDGSISQLVQTNVLSNLSFDAVRTVISPNNELFLLGYVNYVTAFSPLQGIYKFDGTSYNHIPLITANSGADGDVLDGLIQDDGKIVCIGTFQHYNGSVVNRICRLNPNGTLDSSFQTGTGFNNTTPANAITRLAKQIDNKLIVGGYFDSYNGTTVHGPIRLNTDGSIDNSFNSGSGFNNEVFDVAIQPDGKILFVGSFDLYNGNNVPGLCRLNLDGSIDQSFNVLNQNTSFSSVTSVEVLDNGKIMVGGDFSLNLIRLNPDGSLDQTFNYVSSYSNSISGIEVQNDQKLIVKTFGNGIRRINIDGSIDNSFNFSNSGGPISTNLIRLRSNGTLITANGIFNNDGSFQTNNLFNNSFYWYNVNQIRIGPDGRIFFFGEHYAHPGLNMYNGVVCLIDTVPEISGLQVYFDAYHEVSCMYPGYIHANATYGVSPYSFQWLNNGSTDQSFFPNSPGIYGCRVTDNLGNIDTSYIFLEGPDLIGQIDLRASQHTNGFRPGFGGTLWLNASNEGCELSNGELSLIVDTILNINAINPYPSSVNGNQYTWNYNLINSDSGQFIIEIDYEVPTYAQIGDSVSIDVDFNTSDLDIDTSNNSEFQKYPVLNGYDPNFIAAYPEGLCDEKWIDSNQVITYKIHFQNTGNSEAIHVKVIDVLEGPFDVNSLKVFGSSSPVWVEVSENNQLIFHFDDIHLVDSAHDEPNSHGFVYYSIRSLSNSLGSLNNNARIYFDFNPAIVTNTISHMLFNGVVSLDDCVLNSDELLNEVMDYSVFPNPFNNSITVKKNINETRRINICDINGNQLHNVYFTDTQVEIDLSNLNRGLYFLTVYDTSSQLKYSKKIIKI